MSKLVDNFTKLGNGATLTNKALAAFAITTGVTMTAVNTAFRNLTIKQSMSEAVNGAIQAASSGIATLTSMFANTRFSFNQHIAVPHFTLIGSFDAEKGRVPAIMA